MIVYTYTQVILLKQAIPGTLSEENRLIMLFIPRRELIQKDGILGWKVCGVMNDDNISRCLTKSTELDPGRAGYP